MRTAVISDIHGNDEALKPVFNDIYNQKVDWMVCLGDMIGYGPEPERVVERIMRNNIPTVTGNHELATFDDDELEHFTDNAKESIKITKTLISGITQETIQNLPAVLYRQDMEFVHGHPPDSISGYISWQGFREIEYIFDHMEKDIAFVGHTHDFAYLSRNGTQLYKDDIKPGKIILPWGRKHIVNVGSVGQPRDGDNRAKYIIYDNSDHTLESRFIKYDIKKTADKILDLGFPKENAIRLW